jgi:hypothetical protein
VVELASNASRKAAITTVEDTLKQQSRDASFIVVALALLVLRPLGTAQVAKGHAQVAPA